MRIRHLAQCQILRHILCRHHSTAQAAPQVAIIGSGPAGFYTAQQILKSHQTAQVDIYEQLPVPFGLVRFGVAPDHPEVKNVINTFTQTASKERCHFYGNVTVGRDVKVEQLRKHYTAVVLAYGSEDDKQLDIPGEDLTGVQSARRFVGWYNGLPQDRNLPVNLDVESVAVLGQGNVALDVARILLTPVDILKSTDITEHALEVLRESRVKRVYLIGRRGPLQVAFTTAELREMVRLPGCQPQIKHEDVQGLDEIIKDLPRPRRRLTELLYKTAHGEHGRTDDKRWFPVEKDWHLLFHRSPLEFLPDSTGSHVAGIRLGINKLEGAVDGYQKAVPTGETEDLECGLVLRSIGYKTLPIEDSVPFDHQKAVIPNKQGRVEGSTGLYCSGWVKRGPVGVILSTMNDAFETGQCISNDLKEGRLQCSPEHVGATAVKEILNEKGVQVVSFEDWQTIDTAEMDAGRLQGKPRDKITELHKFMEVLK